MVFFGGAYFINTVLCAAFGGNYDLPSVVSYGRDGGAEDLYRGFSHKGGPKVYQVKHDGSLITSNNVTAYGTNTAAVVVSQGPVLFGPEVGGKQMFLDGDGTNSWIVNVNSVTNAAGGGETSIIAPLYDSGTNVTVTSTQSVYSVAVTGASLLLPTSAWDLNYIASTASPQTVDAPSINIIAAELDR